MYLFIYFFFFCGEGSLEPVDDKTRDLYTARELHMTNAPVVCNHGPYGAGE